MVKEVDPKQRHSEVELRDERGRVRRLSTEERAELGLDTEELVRQWEFEPNPKLADDIIKRLDSESREEARQNRNRRGQHSILPRNTFIHPRRSNRR